MQPVGCPLHRIACGRAANMGAQRAGAPVLTGSVPPLAPFYLARQETGCDLADALRPGATVLLVPALLGTGGTGPTHPPLRVAPPPRSAPPAYPAAPVSPRER